MSTNTKTPSIENGPKVLTRADICRLAGVGENSVTSWIESGALPAFDVSAEGAQYKNWRIYESDWLTFQTKRGNRGFLKRMEAPAPVNKIPVPRKKHF
jgi:hypothetical protein